MRIRFCVAAVLLLLADGIVVQGAVHIDRAMIDQAGGGPVYLTEARTTYVLDENLRTTGTAFVVAAGGITLDLGGHGVIYDDGIPLSVTNGGFEDGSGFSIPGWNVTGAMHARRVSASAGMWGKWMLRLPEVSTTQTVISEPIRIPATGREYAAAVSGKGPWKTMIKLSVVDADGQVVASSDDESNDPVTRPAVPNRGFAAVAAFSPRSVRLVRLRIDVKPPPGETVTVDLDHASLTMSRNYGVCATQIWGGKQALPAQLWNEARFQPVYRRAADFTIKNGSIIQGHARSAQSPALFFAGLKGFKVDDIETFVSGMDTHGLDAMWASEGSVLNSCFVARIDRVSNRMRTVCGLSLQNFGGAAVAMGNQFLGQPQTGILFSGADESSSLLASHNYVRQQASVADGYGITVAGAGRFDIEANTIVPVSGRGILVDSWGRTATQNGTIRNNYCRVREALMLEYTDLNGLEPTAFRLRGSGNAVFRKITVAGNHFAAITGPGSYYRAIGSRVNLQNVTKQNDRAEIVFRDNTFRAVAGSADPKYQAWALSLASLDPGTALEFIDNVCESNDVGSVFGDPDGWKMPVTGVRLRGTTYRLAAGAPPRPFTAALVGAGHNRVDQVIIEGSRFADGTRWSIVNGNDEAPGPATGLTVRP
jgi:hypothetical protein